jgi:hypothetical protein
MGSRRGRCRRCQDPHRPLGVGLDVELPAVVLGLKPMARPLSADHHRPELADIPQTVWNLVVVEFSAASTKQPASSRAAISAR